jgi:HEAT repeat protein
MDSLFSGRRDEAQNAAYTLGRIGTEDARQALLGAVTGDDEQLAQAAIGALGQMGGTEDVRGALLKAAQNGKPQVKQQAIQQLVQSGSPEGMKLAEAALGGKDPDAARNAAWALVNVGSAESRRLLEKAALSGDPQVRVAAVQAMAQSGDDHSTDTLLNLARDQDPQVRGAALNALGQVGSGKAVDAVLQAATTGTSDEKIAAVGALGNLDDPRAGTQLASLIHDKDEQVAQTAIYSSYNGGPEIDKALEQLVDDPTSSQALRSAAASQLRSRGVDMDTATSAQVDTILGGPAPAGGYGGGTYYNERDMVE